MGQEQFVKNTVDTASANEIFCLESKSHQQHSEMLLSEPELI